MRSLWIDPCRPTIGFMVVVALVTDQPGVMVAVRTADCVPVLVHDPQRRVVAAIHAGWRGAVVGIVPKTIGLMRSRFGSI